MHPKSVSLPDYPHPSSHQGSNSSPDTSCNQLPTSVDSTHVIYPTSFCIAETLLQFFYYSGSVVWFWYSIWLVHFLPLLFTVHLIYCCQTVSTLPRVRGLLATAKSMQDSSRSLQLYPELQVIPRFLLSALHTLHACLLSRFCHVILFATPWAITHQAPLSRFSRPEYWSGLLGPPPGDLPGPGI